MQTITLGSNGPVVPALGIGTWAWGDKLFWNYGEHYGADQVESAFQTAVDAGITFFDTAEVYGFGESEKLLGRFMKQTQQPVQIATKYGPAPWRLSGQSVSDALTASLERLQCDRVALYQVHWPFTFFMSQSALMNTLADEYQKGRIQAIGVSNYSAAQLREAHKILIDRGVPLAVNQVRYSLLARNIETDGILDAARELGVVILAYSPLAQGLLTGKYTVENYQQPSGARQWKPDFNRDSLAKISPLINLLKELGAQYNRTPAQVALNWLIAQGSVIPIPGAKNAKQAQDNAGALGWSLSADEVEKLSQVSRPLAH